MLSETQLAARIDHTLLNPEASRLDVAGLCREARTHRTATVCVHSCRVIDAVRLLDGSDIAVCSVIGFPTGAGSTAAKIAEARAAAAGGASEFDMVINLGWLHDGDREAVLADIVGVREAIHGRILKVIVESAALCAQELALACELAVGAGADFIKTSTGFHSRGGATIEAVRTIRALVGDRARIKASGGIRDLAAATAMLDAGADRLGMSHTVPILEELRSSATTQ